MSKKLINHNATLISQKRAVVIRGDDGTILALSPALARALAESLPRFADMAERITEPMPEPPELASILASALLRRDTPLQ